MRPALVMAGTLVLVVPAPEASGQSLADRIAGVRDGTVRLSYAARPQVCGDGQFIGFDLPDAFRMYTIGNDGYSSNVMEDVRPDCRAGPLRLVVVKGKEGVRELRAAVGVTWRPSTTATDLGTVPAADAAEWLVEVAETGDDRVARVALLAAAAADSARVAGRVIALARNRRLPVGTRERAMRWMNLLALAEGRAGDADAAFRHLAADDAEPVAVRERAIRDLRPTPESYAYLRGLYGRVADTRLRERIIREIGAGGTEDDMQWVRNVALDTRDALGLRERAIRVLAQRGTPTAELVRLYDAVESVTLKGRIIRILGSRRDDAAGAKLAAIAERDPDAGLRRDAARAVRR